MNKALLALLDSRRVPAVTEGDWIRFPQTGLRISAEVVQEIPHGPMVVVQLDVRFETPSKHLIVESFSFFAETPQKAAHHALHVFAVNTLPVLLAAFFQSKTEKVAQETWFFGDKARRVTVGGVAARGVLPDGVPLDRCMRCIRARLTVLNLSPDTHWVRLFYADNGVTPPVCEILLDNEIWDTALSEAATFDWPSTTEFYSVRCFLVVHPEEDDPTTADGAVAILAKILNTRPGIDEGEAYRALALAGVRRTLAISAYLFTQVAWGRLLMADRDIPFSPEYIVVDADGEVRESGLLADAPCFAAASRLGKRFVGTKGFQEFALTSADAYVVYRALKEGALPEQLRFLPLVLHTAGLSRTGEKRVEAILAEQSEALSKRLEETP